MHLIYFKVLSRSKTAYRYDVVRECRTLFYFYANYAQRGLAAGLVGVCLGAPYGAIAGSAVNAIFQYIW